ncbi:pyridoxamine 5'-phosphate oxidase family protein [Cohnella sp. JJ-181]|uniref:pyridoxamine 5'-phosphate oxidase family protein n=1 Tax=Cohnella rhizoplanae TaxID=2974897 RepID=UPI0022FF9B7B|nr:pyridoxamine 5'-phosphate oxidase family protein [Cohnella sp. JJ-181]CAI6083634.1 General stress protein 26 [Cohnella sp. JJ-181]
MSDLEKKIAEALEKYKFGAFATVHDGQPSLRYMRVFSDGLTILLATHRDTHKVDELEANPKASLLLGLEGRLWPGTIIEVQGEVSISTDEELKSDVWKGYFEKWLDGPQDPDYVILKLKPTLILFTEKDGEQQAWRPA